MKKIVNTLITILILSSCTDKISDEELKYMPYKSGDILIFENQTDKSLDTILISNIVRYLPDGPQIHFNEKIDANNRNENNIVSLSAGYGKHSESYITIKGLSGKQYLNEIEKETKSLLKTRTMNFNDVILLEEKQEGIGSITKVYWSKSKGIVKFVEKDRTIWELIFLGSKE